jgi:hypothetical protein
MWDLVCVFCGCKQSPCMRMSVYIDTVLPMDKGSEYRNAWICVDPLALELILSDQGQDKCCIQEKPEADFARSCSTSTRE